MLKAEIVSVGTELLLGQIVNTNAAFVGRRLASLGIDLYMETTVGDNLERIKNAVRAAGDRADIVILSGGLGPTSDDTTKEAVCSTFGIPLRFNETVQQDIEDYLQKRGFHGPDTGKGSKGNAKQAFVPTGAIILNNLCGTAPGFILKETTTGGPSVIMLPGPPREFEPMWLEGVEPYIAALTSMRREEAVIYSRVLRIAGIGEPTLEQMIADLVQSPDPTVAPCVKGGEIHLRITAKSKSPEEAKRVVQEMDDIISSRLGDLIFGRDHQTLEEAIGGMLTQKGLSLAIAESCTAGLLSARIVNVPGSSTYFLGGVISYSNISKQDTLEVPQDVLQTYGAVSPECAIAMSEGICRKFGANVGVSITGIAGPEGGTPEKPVGTVYLGITKMRQSEPVSIPSEAPTCDTIQRRELGRGAVSVAYRRWFPGRRMDVRERSVEEALILLRRWLLEQGRNER
jgi:nicotinamide-nucleotide amidase